MLKDIPKNKVEDIALAIVKETEDSWTVYLINLKETPIEAVLVTSKGYGKRDGEKVKTSMLRHSLGTIEEKSFVQVEPIMEKVLHLTNEYWVSFFHKKMMFDKKYIVLPESAIPKNLIDIPIINKKGILLK
ncbi:MAG: hypothetical protein HRT71_20015 [Flavobacteriales bacterium]|nr:hypothetical protein [Flavobacteriales bacterium]